MFPKKIKLSPENVEFLQVLTAVGLLALTFLGLMLYAAAVT